MFDRTKSKPAKPPMVDLCLYVAGSAPRSMNAIRSVRRLCDESLVLYRLSVVDIYQQPELARQDQIVAVPTLVRRFPTPVRKFIGDLSGPNSLFFGAEYHSPGALN